MEEYLEKLLAQIRCKKARPYIAEEIRGHIESQIEDNIVSGMTDQEAEKMCIRDRGKTGKTSGIRTSLVNHVFS